MADEMPLDGGMNAARDLGSSILDSIFTEQKLAGGERCFHLRPGLAFGNSNQFDVFRMSAGFGFAAWRR